MTDQALKRAESLLDSYTDNEKPIGNSFYSKVRGMGEKKMLMHWNNAHIQSFGKLQ